MKVLSPVTSKGSVLVTHRYFSHCDIYGDFRAVFGQRDLASYEALVPYDLRKHLGCRLLYGLQKSLCSQNQRNISQVKGKNTIILHSSFPICSLFCRTSLVAQTVRVCLQCRRPRFDLWVRKIPSRRKWQPALVLRSLVGYSSWCCKESDTTGRLSLSLPLFCPWVKGGLRVLVLGWWRWITSPSDGETCWKYRLLWESEERRS